MPHQNIRGYMTISRPKRSHDLAATNEPSRSWHLGTGTGRWGKINTQRCLEKSCGFIFARGTRRSNLLNKFREEARVGDNIYLHTKGMVSYVGEYTGECYQGISHPEYASELCPYLVEMRNISGKKGGWQPSANDEYFIMVSGWKKLTRPFKGEGRRATLYEAPDYESTSQFLENLR